MVASKGMTEDGEKHTVGLESQTRHWATPDCNTSTYSNGLMGPNLRQQAMQWPTPRAEERCQHNSQDSGMALSARTQQWPTPNAHDGRRPGADLKSTQEMNLSRDAVLWPTPASRDYRTPNSESLEARGGGSKGEQLPNFVQHHFSPQGQPTINGQTSCAKPHGSRLHSPLQMTSRTRNDSTQDLPSGSWAGQSDGQEI